MVVAADFYFCVSIISIFSWHHHSLTVPEFRLISSAQCEKFGTFRTESTKSNIATQFDAVLTRCKVLNRAGITFQTGIQTTKLLFPLFYVSRETKWTKWRQHGTKLLWPDYFLNIFKENSKSRHVWCNEHTEDKSEWNEISRNTKRCKGPIKKKWPKKIFNQHLKIAGILWHQELQKKSKGQEENSLGELANVHANYWSQWHQCNQCINAKRTKWFEVKKFSNI